MCVRVVLHRGYRRSSAQCPLCVCVCVCACVRVCVLHREDTPVSQDQDPTFGRRNVVLNVVLKFRLECGPRTRLQAKLRSGSSPENCLGPHSLWLELSPSRWECGTWSWSWSGPVTPGGGGAGGLADRVFTTTRCCALERYRTTRRTEGSCFAPDLPEVDPSIGATVGPSCEWSRTERYDQQKGRWEIWILKSGPK